MKSKVSNFKFQVSGFRFSGLVSCFLFLISVLLLLSCHDKPKLYSGYTQQNNFYYKLLSIGDGKVKPDSSQTLWIDASCSTLKDSVFWDTRHNSSQLFFMNSSAFSFSPGFYDFSIGDSLQYLIPTQLFFKEFFGQPSIAFFCEKDSCIKLNAKILRVLSRSQVTQIQDSLRYLDLQRETNEYSLIHEYVVQNFKNVIGLAPGAFMEITQFSHLDPVKKGRHIKILYTGSYLDGRLVDTNPAGRPFEFIYGQEGQVLEGLRMALARLKKGEKAKIILPSQLAFGRRGSSNGTVVPYTPLLYEIEVVDIK